MSAMSGSIAVSDASASIGASSTLLIGSNSGRNFLLIHNASASASIAVNLSGGTAALNTLGSVTVGPLGTLLFDTAVPRGIINVIASASSTPVTCNWF